MPRVRLAERERMRRLSIAAGLLAVGLALGGLASPVQATTLKAAHPYGDSLREVRHRLLEVMARELRRRAPDLDLKIYPRGRLFAASELWLGLTSGTLELALLPLAPLAGVDPVFADPGLPGLVTTSAEAKALHDAPLMQAVRRALLDRGVRVLADVWVPGAFVSRDGVCRHAPADFAGVTLADGGRAVGEIAATQGARRGADEAKAQVVAQPDLDLLTAEGTGLCASVAGPGAVWFDFQPLVMGERAWQRLSPGDQVALRQAAAAAQEYARVAVEQAMEAPDVRLEAFVKQGGRLHVFTPEDLLAWSALARSRLDQALVPALPPAVPQPLPPE